MNDTMVVSGSGAGIVKLWDLPKLLDMPVKMFSFKKWLKWFSSFFLNFPDCPSGRWDHPASEEDQHEGGPPLPHQGDLPVYLHWPCHHCKVRSSVMTVEWPLVTRYEGKKKKDKVKIVEVSWNWLQMKAQARWFFLQKFLHLANCHVWSINLVTQLWSNCQLHTDPSYFILSYFFKKYISFLNAWLWF